MPVSLPLWAPVFRFTQDEETGWWICCSDKIAGLYVTAPTEAEAEAKANEAIRRMAALEGVTWFEWFHRRMNEWEQMVKACQDIQGAAKT